jgi:hypothetical protein
MDEDGLNWEEETRKDDIRIRIPVPVPQHETHSPRADDESDESS